MSRGDIAVPDASALVEMVQGRVLGREVADALLGRAAHAPAHVDAEVLSALGRGRRAGDLTDEQVTEQLHRLRDIPLVRHPLPPLLVGAWARRQNVRLADALYVELAEQLDVPLVTTDRRLTRATSRAEIPGD